MDTRIDESLTKLTKAEVQRDLNQFIPRTPPDSIIDDAVFLAIETILSSNPSTRVWSSRPRIYCLLRMLGLDQESPVFKSFLEEDLHDVALPFREIYLPMALKDEKDLCERFLSKQMTVCTRTELMNGTHFMVPTSLHRHIHDGRAHFEELDHLGKGGSASVDRVRHKLSGLSFARKKILRGHNIETQKQKLREFQKELKALGKLHHKHLVRRVGSYTDIWSFSLILTPVAEMELKALLFQPAVTHEEKGWLRNAFGCIATAVAYCHEQKLRHKDVKPGNILLNDGQIYLCDFGISYDWNDEDHATTSGEPGRYTRRYSAPEVASAHARNEKSDIWSMGCVYLEMISVIKGFTIDSADRFRIEDGSPAEDYWCQPESMTRWLDSIRDGSPDDVAIDWIKDMIRTDPSARPTAMDIVGDIQSHFQSVQTDEWFIGRCCVKSVSHSSQLSPESGSRSDSSVGPTDKIPWRVNRSSPNHTTQSFHASSADRLNSTGSSSDTPLGRGYESASLKVPYHRHSSSRPYGSSISSIPEPDSATSPLSRQQSLPVGIRPNPSTYQSPPVGPFEPTATPLNSPPLSLPLPELGIRTPEPYGSPGVPDITPDSLATMTEPACDCLCGGKANERQLFEAPICSWRNLEGAAFSQQSDVCNEKSPVVRLYESTASSVWEVTRRLVVSMSSERHSNLQCTSFWLPLSDTLIRLNDDHLELWWSDCNQVSKRKSGNYGDLFDWIYDANCPNHHIVLQLAASQAESMAYWFLRPSKTGTMERLQQPGHSPGSIFLSEKQTAHLYNAYRKSPANLSQSLRRLEYRVLVLLEGSGDSMVLTKTYCVYPDLDFQMHLMNVEMDQHNKESWRFHLVIKGLTSPTYISDRLEEPNADPNKQATCKEVKQIRSEAVIDLPLGADRQFPTPPQDLVNLLKGLTTWNLSFFSAISSFKTKRTFGGKDSGHGDLTVWQKITDSGRVCQMAFRMYPDPQRDPRQEKLWTTGRVKRNSHISSSGSNDDYSLIHKSNYTIDATLRIFNKASGPLLDIERMAAHDPRNRDPNAHRASQNREEHSNISIKFDRIEDRLAFCKLILHIKESLATTIPDEIGRSSAHTGLRHARVDSTGSEATSPGFWNTRTSSTLPDHAPGR